MKLAIISDIHGNIAALDAVLADIAACGVDQTVNLGDIVSGPLFPEETADRLIPLDFPTIRGNHERQLLETTPDEMGLSDRYAALTLRPDQLAWMASLPVTMSLSDDVMLVHGTASSDLVYFLETVTPDGLRPATRDEILDRASGVSAGLILCGHTHIPRMVRLADGRMIVNPGSVGLPAYDDDRPHPHIVETGSPYARYAIVEKNSDGWSADLRTVEYDWEAAARKAEASDRMDWAKALRTGRV